MHMFCTCQAIASLLCALAGVFSAYGATDVPSPEAAAEAVAARSAASTLYGESYAGTDVISDAAGLDCAAVRASVFATCAKEMPNRAEWDAQTNSVTTAYAVRGITIGSANRLKSQCAALASFYGITNISAWTQGLGRPERDVQTDTGADTDADTGAESGSE